VERDIRTIDLPFNRTYVVTLLGGVLLASGIVRSAQAVETVSVDADVPQVFVHLSGPMSDACVLLLHGLARTASSMEDLAVVLGRAGYRVANVDYPSRHHRIENLSELAIPAGVDACRNSGSSLIDIVTHSLGGIMVRDYLSRHVIGELNRVVMLAPPNHGSAVVDKLEGMPGFSWLNGPAIEQLGTDERSLPLSLGPATVDTAIIAGTHSINLYLSTFLENPKDGKVSVSSARLDGMCAMLTLGVSHPFIMSDEVVMEQTVSYLDTGRFTLGEAEYPDCAFR
jgi:hypothetical protein